MEAKEIAQFIETMFEDELDILSRLLSLFDPERADAMLLRENGGPDCPKCKLAMKKNGTEQGKTFEGNANKPV